MTGHDRVYFTLYIGVYCYRCNKKPKHYMYYNLLDHKKTPNLNTYLGKNKSDCYFKINLWFAFLKQCIKSNVCYVLKLQKSVFCMFCNIFMCELNNLIAIFFILNFFFGSEGCNVVQFNVYLKRWLLFIKD